MTKDTLERKKGEVGDSTQISEREQLLNNLLDAVKQCQIRFGGRTELATESDPRVLLLCTKLEAVLNHGIKKNNTKGPSALRQVTEMMKGFNILTSDPEPVFWHFVRQHLTRHEHERYLLLKNVSTDYGRGRAWIRSSLNEHSLERYVHMFLCDVNIISQSYEDWAFLMDQERSSMLSTMAAGLGSILFAISIDNSELNGPDNQGQPNTVTNGVDSYASDEPQPVMVANSVKNSKEKKRKKRKPASQVVSFDDEDAVEINPEWNLDIPNQTWNSAPPTCLSSPVSLSGNFSALHSNASKDKNSATKTSPSKTEQEEISCTNSSSVDNSPNIPINQPILTPEMKEVRTSSSWTPGSSNYPEWSTPKPKEETSKNNRVMTLIGICNTGRHSPLPEQGSLQRPESQASIGSSISDKEEIKNYSKGDGKNSKFHSTLTPVSDVSIGELVPITMTDDVPSSVLYATEDSISIPSFGEETENAAAALAMAQRLANWTPSTVNNVSQSVPATQAYENKPWEPRTRSETLTMTNEELRDALLAVLRRKEEIEEKNGSLRSLLDREMELSAALRAELVEVTKQFEDKREKQDVKVQALTRENELLKHQLKKYISAVQMLKRDKVPESLNNVVGDIQPALPEPKPFIDHQFEVTEYERKLVQVAEMHGELMEFNERLHRTLLIRESTIRRLKEELVDLRGPLPDDNQTSDDDLSITSDYDASSQTAAARSLINIWIPSAFLSGKSTDVHHVYQVYVRIRDEEWNIYRRYSQFYSLHKSLKKKLPIVHTFDFPPKKTIGKKGTKVVEERRRRLQHYLRCVINLLLQSSVELANNPDRETFMSLLPFFREQTTEPNVQRSVLNAQRRRFPSMGSLTAQSESQYSQNTPPPQPVHLYTGL